MADCAFQGIRTNAEVNVMAMDITGRKLFVKALLEEGVDTVFGYPGGMVTDILDEL